MTQTNSVPQGLFGPGIAIVTRTDVPNASPVNVGFCNEFSYDMSADVKELYGQNRLPLLTAAGTMKCTGKIKAATFSGQALNAALFGGSFTAGQTSLKVTGPTAIPTTPFTITPTVPDTGTFDIDLGVTNAETGEPLTSVASGPTAGEYSHVAGVYTFSSADHSSAISVKIAYAYTHTASGGQTLLYANSLIGSQPTFQLDYSTILYGAEYNMRFFNAISSKLSMGHKLTDFAMPELDFSFFCNAAGNLFQLSLATTA